MQGWSNTRVALLTGRCKCRNQAITLIDPESTCREVNECNGDFSPTDPSKLVATAAQLFVNEVIKRYASELVQRSERRFDGIYNFAGIEVLLRSVHLS